VIDDEEKALIIEKPRTPDDVIRTYNMLNMDSPIIDELEFVGQPDGPYI